MMKNVQHTTPLQKNKEKAMNPLLHASKCLLALILTVTLVACGGGGGSDNSGGNPPPPTSNPPTDEDPNDGNNDPSPPTTAQIAAEIHRLDITGAQGFVVTDQAEPNNAPWTAASIPQLPSQKIDFEITATSTSGGMEPGKLYKVTADGRLEEVPFENEQGEEVTRGQLTPKAVLEVGDDFLYVAVEISIAGGGNDMV